MRSVSRSTTRTLLGGLTTSVVLLGRRSPFNCSMNYFVVEKPDAFADRLPTDYTQIYEQRDTGWKGR
jgi:hypothetical protein